MTDPTDRRPGEELASDTDVASALAGTDGPRVVPPAVAARMVALVGSPTVAAGGARRPGRGVFAGVGTAAALVLVVALVAAGMYSTDRDTASVAGPATTSTTTARSPLVAAAPSQPGTAPSTSAGGVVGVSGGEAVRADLTPARDCSTLLDWFRRNAEAEMEPWGLGPRFVVMPTGGTAEPVAAPAAGSPGADNGGTNVQEGSVDEADLAKVGDGVAVYSPAWSPGRAVTRVVSLDGGPRLASELDLGGWSRYILVGRTLVSVTQLQDRPATAVRVHDLTDPAAPRLVSERILDEVWVTEIRRTGDVVRLVTTQSRQPVWDQPADESEAEQARALEENRRRARESELSDWVDPGVDCTAVHLPPELSGFDLLRVESFPVQDPTSLRTTAVVGSWSTGVYASEHALVIGTWVWEDEMPARTAIHRLAWSGAGVDYTGSGWVPGFVGDPWRFSEHDGVLRVVSDGTDDGIRLSVLDASSPTLAELGALTGFPAGHSAFGIRFQGPIGFVVTYERRDPLHVVDLTDPSRPRFRGILQTPGVAEYLHPVGDGVLLGVGYDDDRRPQVVLYDVRDLDAPTRPAVVPLDAFDVGAAYDHHAFTWMAHLGRAVLPGLMRGDRPAAAAVMAVAGQSLTLAGEIQHPYESPEPEEPAPCPEPDPTPVIPRPGGGSDAECPDDGGGVGSEPDYQAIAAASIERSLPWGDAVLTFSPSGMAVTSVPDLERVAFVEFPVGSGTP